jgi:hypothetical protein
MSHALQDTLWARLRRSWLQPELEARLAEDAGLPVKPQRRFLSPLVGAWLH